MPGITIRPYSFIGRILTTAFTSALFFSLCYFFDYNNHINILYSIFTLQALILIVIHSSYLKDKRFFNASMRRLYLTSPEDHLLHHSYTTGYINYGNISILWDVLFKTYKKYSQNELYLAGTGIEKDYVESVTFGVFNLKKFLEKRSL
jgi:sterol desaturase/sphingolipid hydroxylase (fatty acid hydroxylase superfamily)